jgi:hypothetical protein
MLEKPKLRDTKTSHIVNEPKTRGKLPSFENKSIHPQAIANPSHQCIVGMTTHPRNPSTLEQSLYSVKHAGFNSLYLFSDGYTNPPIINGLKITTIQRETPIGCYGNWLASMVELWTRHPEASYYVFVQDDVVLSKNVKQYLERMTLPSTGFMSLYAAHKREGTKTGFHMLPRELSGMGAHCYVFTPQALHKLLANPFFINHRYGKTKINGRYLKGHKHIDSAISRSFYAIGEGEWSHHPSLAQHIGETSTLGHGSLTRKRTSKSFKGETFDALSLLPPIPKTYPCIHRGIKPVKFPACGCTKPPKAFHCFNALTDTSRCIIDGDNNAKQTADDNGYLICSLCPHRET